SAQRLSWFSPRSPRSPRFRSFMASEMTRQTIVRGVLLPVTVHAESHIQVHVALRDRLLRDRTMTRRAFHVRADVRRVIEADMRFVRVPVDALPREIVAALLEVRDLLDERFIGRDRVVTDHARLDAGQTGDRPL